MAIRKILIVDDSPTERHVLNDMLTKSGLRGRGQRQRRGRDPQGQVAQARPDPDGRRHAGPERLPGDARDQPRPGHPRDPDHPLHVEEPGNRQDLGHAPGRARLHRQARQPRRAAGEDRRRSADAVNGATLPMARAAKLDLRTFQQELASRLATKTAAQVESSRLGLASGGERWLVRLADAGEVTTLPNDRSGAADPALVPRASPTSAATSFRVIDFSAFLGRDSGVGRRAEPPGAVRPAGGRNERRHRRPACARPAQHRRAGAGGAAARRARPGTRSAGWTATATPGRKSISQSSRSDSAFLQVGI